MGALPARHARTVGHAVERMHVELAEYADGHGATVRVLANTAATASVLTPALNSDLAAHPTVRVDTAEHPSHRIVAAVAEHRAELGIVADTVDLGHLETHTLRPDPLVVLTAPDEPLSRRASVSYAAVLNRPFVGLSHPSALPEHPEGHAVPLGSQPAYRVRLSSIDAVCYTVAAGIGSPSCPATPSIHESAAGASPRSPSTSRGPTATSPFASPPKANSPAPHVPCGITSPPATAGLPRQPHGQPNPPDSRSGLDRC